MDRAFGLNGYHAIALQNKSEEDILYRPGGYEQRIARDVYVLLCIGTVCSFVFNGPFLF